jgi:integrase/recombinase XerD
MSALREAVNDYITMRRGLGFKLESLAKLLRSFVAFCEDRSVDHVTNDIALEWATLRIKVVGNEALYARRLDAVRIFARHQHALDPATEIPPDDVLGRRYRSHPPRLFTDAEMVALLDAAGRLTPRMKAATWQTVIGLLAATGMWPGEACRLNLHDVNLADGVVRIAKTKFDKSRIVFLHPTAAMAMGDYLRIRTDWMSTRARQCATFFVNMNGSPINVGSSSKVFRLVLATAGISALIDEPPPRLHDLRHTFAVNTMLDWYRDGGDVQARLPLLSTWLGHVDPVSTYWYLQAVPELLALAAGRLEPDTAKVNTETPS